MEIDLDKSRTLYINSKNRTHGDSTDFSVQLDLPREIEFDRVVCLAASIPKSFYLIGHDSIFYLNEGILQAAITMPRGNYSLSAFKSTVISLLNAHSPNNWTYNVSYPARSSTDTGKLRYTVSGNTSQPSLQFTEKLYEQFGFDKNSTNQFTLGTLDSTNVINLQKESTLYIHSDMCDSGNDNILASVYANDSTDFGSITYKYQDAHVESKKLVSNKSNTFRFYLTDEDEVPINLNGQNWVMTLLFFKSMSNFKLNRIVATE